MKLLKLVLGDTFADIGMGDLNFDRLNQLGIHDDIESVEESEVSLDKYESNFKIPQLY